MHIYSYLPWNISVNKFNVLWMNTQVFTFHYIFKSYSFLPVYFISRLFNSKDFLSKSIFFYTTGQKQIN